MVEAQFWRDDTLPFLESRRACRTVSCYKPHSHDALSIGAVDDGGSVFTGAPGGPVRLAAGTLVVIPPRRVHACNPVGDRWSYQMLHIDERWFAEALPECGVAAARPVRVIDTPGPYAAFCRLNEMLFSGADPREKEELLVAVLDDLFTAPAYLLPGTGTGTGTEDATLVAEVLERLRTSDMQVRLGDLACGTGLSRYQLVRRFRKVTGLPPLAWQINERVLRARALLRAGGDLAEVASTLGFADQSHFHRVFKQRTGVTPGEYRAGLTR